MSDPRIWGTDLWKTLHRFSLAYPKDSPSDQHKQKARDFYGSLDYMLPCPWCKVHYGRYFKRTFTDETVASREALVKWVYDLHNEVNRRLGKPKSDVTIEDLPRLYNSFPLRYVDLTTGDLLDKPRHEVTEGRDCPSDEAVLNNLLQKKRREKRLDKTATSDKSTDTVAGSSQQHTGLSTNSGASQVLSDQRSSVAAIESNGRSFWMSPWGVSLLWLTGLVAILLIVVVVRLASASRQQAEKRQGRQQWVVFDDATGEPTAANTALPAGYRNPWL